VNKNILITALKELGWNPVEYKIPTKLRNYVGKKQNIFADIVVPKEQLDESFTGMSNDLGFRWNNEENKYDMICSDYDEVQKIHQRVKQMYAKIAIEKALGEHKFAIKQSTENSELRKRIVQNKVQIIAQKVI
jgi:hypothetical protein